jgi:hypothetical protein
MSEAPELNKYCLSHMSEYRRGLDSWLDLLMTRDYALQITDTHTHTH